MYASMIHISIAVIAIMHIHVCINYASSVHNVCNMYAIEFVIQHGFDISNYAQSNSDHTHSYVTAVTGQR